MEGLAQHPWWGKLCMWIGPPCPAHRLLGVTLLFCPWDPSIPWEGPDAGYEVESGIPMMAECVLSFSGCALHREARSAAGQHVHRATKKTPSAAEHTRAFVFSFLLLIRRLDDRGLITMLNPHLFGRG